MELLNLTTLPTYFGVFSVSYPHVYRDCSGLHDPCTSRFACRAHSSASYAGTHTAGGYPITYRGAVPSAYSWAYCLSKW